MSGVEFVPEPADRPDRVPTPPRRPSYPRIALVAGAAVLAAVAAISALHNGDSHRPAVTALSTLPPLPTPKPTLRLPESVAFGREAVDVAVVGSRVYTLTSTLIGIADRDSSAVTVRSVPLGLAEVSGRPRVLVDADHGLVWAVDLAGTAIAGYSSDNLDKLTDRVAATRINAAAAVDEQLYFTTDQGVFTTVAGAGPVRKVDGGRYGVIGGDGFLHIVWAADDDGVLHGFAQQLRIPPVHLPFDHVTAILGSYGPVWVSGYGGAGPQVGRLRPDGYRRIASLGPQPELVGAYHDRALVRTDPTSSSVECIDTSGRVRQTWSVPPGSGLALNERGLLFTSHRGIQLRNARDCLA